MAEQIQVDGVAVIKIASPANGTLETLGKTINGAEVTERLFTEEVKGDENGGDPGPPIDIQMLGEIHIVRLTLSKYDEAILNKVRASLAGGTAGTPGTSGTLYFQDSKSWRLLIHTTNRPRNYTNVIFREPKEVNKGTIHSKATIIAECHKDANGVLYNSTTT